MHFTNSIKIYRRGFKAKIIKWRKIINKASKVVRKIIRKRKRMKTSKSKEEEYWLV